VTLIFDEVITGFRLATDGAQGYYHVCPDLSTFGKIIGGGMPVGAYGGRRDIMERVAPRGPVYQAGTLSGNPVAMAAGLAQLRILKDSPDFYGKLNKTGDSFFGELKQLVQQERIPCQVNHVGSLGCLFFTEQHVRDYASAQTSDTDRYTAYFRHMIDRGILLAPSQFEAVFLSCAHCDADLDRTLEAVRDFFR
jgi:glutamate-1-semialdehyde 2,1-aminomutase (EC 5.4.3.8)